MLYLRLTVVTVVILVAASLAVAADSPPRKSADELPQVKDLANPFVFLDGSAVKTKEDWERRRKELKGLFEDYEYGHLPPQPEKMTVTRGEVKIDAAAKSSRQDWEIKLEQGGKTLVLHAALTLPLKAERKLPVIVQGAFGRPGMPLGTGGGLPGKGPPRGNRLVIFTDRGYGVAECNLQEAALDSKQARTSGVYQLFGDQIDCGGLMAWVWGISRVIDALEQDDRIDAKKIVVTGHSRYGKAALLAGAFDDRIALTVPSHSGCGGAAPYRFIYGKNEQLQNIVGAFPYWFRPDFNQFVDKVDRLPVDQHLLIALIAPRAQLTTEGTQDTWINPQGSQLTHLAAKKVYTFLGAEDK